MEAEKPKIHKSKLGTSAARTHTAMQTPKNQQIQKYGKSEHRTSVAKTTHPDMKVAEQPKQTDSKPHETHQKTARTTNHQEAQIQTTNQKMLDKALASASSHEQEVPVHHKKKRSKLSKKLGISPKAASVSLVVIAFVLLAGFFTVQSVPSLSMRLAATRAGFDASMPGYQPSGFSFSGPINYSPGQVTISFKSNTDNREYDVKQEASNWNSDALLSNYVLAEGKTYQTYLDRGRTLFIYDGSNATWVDDGVWYTVEGESSMTTDQLIRIASSI